MYNICSFCLSAWIYIYIMHIQNMPTYTKKSKCRALHLMSSHMIWLWNSRYHFIQNAQSTLLFLDICFGIQGGGSQWLWYKIPRVLWKTGLIIGLIIIGGIREWGRERDKDSEGPSVWKQPRSNLAANLLPFPHINLKSGNGPQRASEIDRHVIIGCEFPLKGSGRSMERSSSQNTFLILALINNLPMPLCNETQRNVFKYEANHIHAHNQVTEGRKKRGIVWNWFWKWEVQVEMLFLVRADV